MAQWSHALPLLERRRNTRIWKGFGVAAAAAGDSTAVHPAIAAAVGAAEGGVCTWAAVTAQRPME